MRAVVTGGAGFIGSHVVDALVARGDDVSVVDSLATGKRENVSEGAMLHVHDIREPLDELFDESVPKRSSTSQPRQTSASPSSTRSRTPR